MRGKPVRTMTEPQGRYSAYLLRLWQTASSGELVCRASIEDAHSTERVGFGSLDELFDYLRARAGQVSEAEGRKWRAGAQVTGKEVNGSRGPTISSEGNGNLNELQAEQSHKGEENEKG